MNQSGKVEPMPLTEMRKTRQEKTGLTGTGEHGSSVLLRYAKSKGYSDTQLKLKVGGEVSSAHETLWVSSIWTVFKAIDRMKAQR